ncbi:contractile injection system tape measure protein [uncultured Alistipes sp.]|nr:contractile injection system tape measure protein [uncultured Alistipes sp.]
MDKEELYVPGQISYINNAGIVLLNPFLPLLFNMLNMTANNNFKTKEDRYTAIFLMQYAVYGDSRTEFPEHELVLNMRLVGLPTEADIPNSYELTQGQRDTVDSMLKGALQHWNKMKNTSIEALREAFLQRDGKLELWDNLVLLTVVDRAYDILLHSLPWSLRNIKYGWMDKTLEVKWR